LITKLVVPVAELKLRRACGGVHHEMHEQFMNAMRINQRMLEKWE
jgi:hypothetical protein